MPDPSSELTAAPAVVDAPVSDVKPAPEASTEQPKGVETTLLDRVTDVLKKGTESPTVTDGKAVADPLDTAKKVDPAKVDAKAGPDTETGKYPKTAEGRIRFLNDRTKELSGEVERLKPDADLAQKIMGYLDTNGIQPEELDNTLALTALIKRGDYEAALKVLDPIHRELLNRTGEILPADLQEKVRLGHMTRAVATELHKSRVKAQNAENREKQTTAKTAADRETQAHQTMVRTAASATSEWERAQAAADPDWHQKQDLVAEQVELELRRLGPAGYPKTPQDAVGIAEKAKKAVEERLKKLAPKPQARQMPTGLTSPRAKAQPKSLMEAVNAALGG